MGGVEDIKKEHQILSRKEKRKTTNSPYETAISKPSDIPTIEGKNFAENPKKKRG